MKKLSAKVKALMTTILLLLILILIVVLSVNFPKVMAIVLLSSGIGIFMHSTYNIFKSFFENGK